MIHDEINQIDPTYHFSSAIEDAIITRAIHTTADFDYMNSLSFTNKGIQRVANVLQNGGEIYTDTTMALSGINKRKLNELNVNYQCLIADPKTFELAAKKHITRSMAAIEMAAQSNREKIFVIGNAPTALYKILEMHDQNQLDVSAVVGVPVGFVEAKESKIAMDESSIPSIVNIDRKGGSNLAAAIVNAILYNLDLASGE
ncbi:precorrin-8X methylmutase [Pediococcus claussenii]|uniref:Cobalt-precorrin-8X methylmutase n=2 Tax=Pediococcus claussenii TaxID=187452 RepID=G8PEL6_PEDCP|nr:precorrin-8X methylmutase [Pediococcus claussenii]AEV95625.1 cobalt-precorrin-8X methylmutase [Pediococcus claussenii ATCC BAA-344]